MSDRDPVEVLADEFVARYRNGERPSITEYATRYPEFADYVRRVFPTLVMMERLAPGDDASLQDALPGFDAADNLQQLECVGDFRIIREVGRGGMGLVYEAEQLSLGRHVALKVLPKQALQNPIHRQRFEREARAAARLHHTNIVPVFGVGEHEGMLFYVMQFIHGMSLDKVLADLKRQRDAAADTAERSHAAGTVYEKLDPSGPSSDPSSTPARSEAAEQHAADTAVNCLTDTFSLTGSGGHGKGKAAYWRSVARIGIQVAEALEHAHSQGICHRDIKPANLLLDGRGTVWITDFGLAKTGEQEDLTKTGDLVGTLRYMAPERFDGRSDPRSDIYSLGLTLYELLSLQPVFDESDRNRLIRKVMDGAPTPLRKLNRDIPRDLETIVQKAIERDPNHRVQTAGELAADLRRFLEDEPVRARRVSVAERLWRWCRRNPGVSWASAACVVSIAIAFVVVKYQRDEARRQAGTIGDQNKSITALLKQEQAARHAEEAAHKAADREANEANVITEFFIRDMVGADSSAQSSGQQISVRQMIDLAAARVETAFPDQPEKEAAVREAVGRVYHFLGLYDQAQQQLDSALTLRRELLGDEHLQTLTTMLNVASNDHAAGRFAEAQELQEQALATLTSVYGPQHPQAVTSMANLAATFDALGQLAESRKLYEQVLELRQASLGPEAPQTLAALSNLAVVVERQGDLAAAEQMHREVVSVKERVLGAKDPSTLRTLGNLAHNLVLQDRSEEAEAIHTRVLDVRRRVLGSKHPHTLAAMNNLAAALVKQKKNPAAQEILSELVTVFRELLGPDHPSTITALGNLGTSLWDEKKYAEAEKCFAEVVAFAEKRLGSDHASTLLLKDNLADCLQHQDRPAEAQTLLEEVVESNRRLLGPQHANTLVSINSLAHVLLSQGKHAEAERLLRSSLDESRKATPPDVHWLTGNAQSLLGSTLTAGGRFAEAEPLLLSGYRNMTSDQRAPEPKIRQALERIVQLYQAWNKPDQAALWKDKLMEVEEGRDG